MLHNRSLNEQGHPFYTKGFFFLKWRCGPVYSDELSLRVLNGSLTSSPINFSDFFFIFMWHLISNGRLIFEKMEVKICRHSYQLISHTLYRNLAGNILQWRPWYVTLKTWISNEGSHITRYQTWWEIEFENMEVYNQMLQIIVIKTQLAATSYGTSQL